MTGIDQWTRIYDRLNSNEIRGLRVERDGLMVRIVRQVGDTEQPQRVLTLTPQDAVGLAGDMLKAVEEIQIKARRE